MQAQHTETNISILSAQPRDMRAKLENYDYESSHCLILIFWGKSIVKPFSLKMTMNNLASHSLKIC